MIGPVAAVIGPCLSASCALTARGGMASDCVRDEALNSIVFFCGFGYRRRCSCCTGIADTERQRLRGVAFPFGARPRPAAPT